MHHFQKKTHNVILLSLIFSIAIRAFFSFPIDNIHLPGGSDISSHLFRSWFVTTYGFKKWNFYWWGGHPFLRYFSPLQYWISGSLGKITGWLLSYNLTIDIFFVITPIAFYLFLNEFKLSPIKTAIGVIILSLFPLYFYYFFDGRHPTLVSFFFCILYWKFLKKYTDKGTLLPLLLSSLFLFFSIISHYLTSIFCVAISFVWLISYSRKITTFFKISKILILAILLSTWFWAPLVIETLIKRQLIGSSYLVAQNNFVETGKEIAMAPTTYMKAFYQTSFPIFIVYLIVISLGIVSLFSLIKPNKISKDFLVVAIFILVLLFIAAYKRSIIFLPISVIVLTVEGLCKIKKWKFIFAFLFLVLVLNIFLVKKYVYTIPEVPNIPKDGRVIYFPIASAFEKSLEEEEKGGYELILAPMNGNEHIMGWWIPGEISYKKYENTGLFDPINKTHDEYYDILRNNWVNYVAVNKRDKEVLSYFLNNTYFKSYNTTNMFQIFESHPKSSYIEINNKTISNIDLKKKDDEIHINFACEPGKLTIKESYHSNWQVFLNGKKIEIMPNDYDFIITNITTSGKCNLNMYFLDPPYYVIFNLISLITIIFILYGSIKEIYFLKYNYEQ
jgi:hypothetical protein